MAQNDGCVHDLTYLLKVHDDGGYTGRMLEFPAVIVAGTTRETISTEMEKSAHAYLCQFTEEHDKAVKGDLPSQLCTPNNGKVVETVKFKVKC